MIALAAPDPAWPARAQEEMRLWQARVSGLVDIHHIGSTAVPGLIAKPILDLLPVFADAAAADGARAALEARGYEWMGAYGLPGRRYVRRDDPETGRRVVQAHGYVLGHRDIARHLAFRDALRADPALRDAYAARKTRCAAEASPSAYGACKSGFIDTIEARALARQNKGTDR